jgi:hypothetical protein
MHCSRHLVGLGMMAVLIDPAEDHFLRRDVELAHGKLTHGRCCKRGGHEEADEGEDYAMHQLSPYPPVPGAKSINGVGRNRGTIGARSKRKRGFLWLDAAFLQRPGSRSLRQNKASQGGTS